jgi:DNA-binding LacI/PurR family transcriptional regulator
MQPTSLAHIAERLGISKMSVSRALRGERHVSAALRQRVLQAAAEIGYRPDPEMTKLMQHLRLGRAYSSPKKIAFVWTDLNNENTNAYSWPSQLLKGAHHHAKRLGYELEEFVLAQRGMSSRRLSGILEARGIHSVIISPLISRSRGHLSMTWEKFSTVVIGLGYARPALHRVHHHHYLGMMTAMRMLKKERFRRIGFYCPSTINERMFGAWSASFLTHHPLTQPGGLLALRKQTSLIDFLQWVQKEKPEVIIDSAHLLSEWLKKLPTQSRPQVVTLGWRADHPQTAGIDQQPAALGEAAVDLIVAQMQQNQRGIPAIPRLVLTEGIWRPASASTSRAVKKALEP